jgi:Short-chain alcohol dehydrogenase of unknown specificity
MFDLKDKVAVVTGAASGIGEAIAKTFARAGAFIYVADLDVKNGKRVTDDIVNSNGHAFFLELDLARSPSCGSVVDAVHDEWDRIDILVNNAGIGHVGTILETTADDLDRLYTVNVRGTFELTRACIPKMIERRYGVIVNLASIGGVVAIKERLAYCTTKFAVVGFHKMSCIRSCETGHQSKCHLPRPRRNALCQKTHRRISRP